MPYELHPLCTLFPRVQGQEFESLKQDIKENGLTHPIVIHEGTILDGGNMAFRDFARQLCVPERILRAFLTPHILTRHHTPSGSNFYKVAKRYKGRGWFARPTSSGNPLFTEKGRREISELFRAWQAGRSLH